MRSPLSVRYVSATVRECVLFAIDPRDEENAEGVLLRAVSAYVPCGLGAVGIVPIVCAGGVGTVRFHEGPPHDPFHRGCIIIEGCLVPPRDDPLKYLMLRLSNLKEVIWYERAKRGVVSSLPVLHKSAMRVVQGWCVLFEDKLHNCGAEAFVYERLIDTIISIAIKVAFGRLDEEVALSRLFRFGRRQAA